MKSLLKQLWEGKTLLRIKMHEELREHALSGIVVDIGGGRNPEYLSYFASTRHADIIPVDLRKTNTGVQLDLESDPLPFSSGSADIILMFNLLEHIFNHKFVVSESFRILKNGGKIIGFVPFFIQYHPDPHDYFRYTKEALQIILTEAGYINMHIVEVGGGPFLVNYNTLMLSCPVVVRIALYPFYALLDKLFLWARPNARIRYPLGYLFLSTKL